MRVLWRSILIYMKTTAGPLIAVMCAGACSHAASAAAAAVAAGAGWVGTRHAVASHLEWGCEAKQATGKECAASNLIHCFEPWRWLRFPFVGGEHTRLYFGFLDSCT